MASSTDHNALVGEFDASVWARAFVAVVAQRPAIATDEGTMTGWFANALMAGYDEAQRRNADLLAACREALLWYGPDGDHIGDPARPLLLAAIAKAERGR